MITYLNKLSGSWLFKGILILTGLSFVGLWGAGGLLNFEGRGATLAKVGRVSITDKDIMSDIQRELQLIRRLMPGVTERDAVALGMVDSSLNNRIYSQVIARSAKDLRIGVGDAALSAALQASPDFRGHDGRFDRQRFRFALTQQGISEVAFLDQMRNQLAGMFMFASAGNSAHVPDIMLNSLIKQYNATRIVEIYQPRPALVARPSDDQLADFYETRRDMFTLPETRQVQVLNVPESAIIRVEDALGEGLGLSDIAKKLDLRYSRLSVNRQATALDEDVMDMIFRARVGRPSEVVENGRELIVFNVTDIIAARGQELGAVRAQLTAMWMAEQRETMAARQAQKLLDDLNAGKRPDIRSTSATIKAGDSRAAPAAIVARARALQPGQAAIVATADGPRVIRLARVVPTAEGMPADQVRRMLTDELAEDMGSMLMDSLSQQINVRVRQDAVDAFKRRLAGGAGE
ncbi:MAG: peptidylprolyl isomerase [Alphaproteobacteria bacterium]|nr:peptidylprolyl isomerase [Alphaproteobacteria bacterium]